MRWVWWMVILGCSPSAVEPGADGATDGSGEVSSDPTDGSTDGTDEAGRSGETGRLEGITEAHNRVREALGIGDLTWDDELAEVAGEWIAFLASDGCYLEHDYSSSYGENLYWSSFSATAEDVVQAWVSEVQFYDYDSNTCAPGKMCGHYTQVVWEDTKRVGCELISCPDSSEIWMCVYDPPGNWVGEWPY